MTNRYLFYYRDKHIEQGIAELCPKGFDSPSAAVALCALAHQL